MALQNTAALLSTGPAQGDDVFFRSYDWCLNPILSLRQQFQRLREEVGRGPAVAGSWQERESRINTYLFVCAIACTVDDYLAWTSYDVSSLCARFAALAGVLIPAGALLNYLTGLFRRPRKRVVLRWRLAWGPVVDRACALLTDGDDGRGWELLGRDIEELADARLPRPLLERRLRIPEAFRCQDLAHPDVFALVDRFMELPMSRSAPIVVIGPRTAGAYMAPLAKSYLVSAGWSDVCWFTVRPRNGISRREANGIRRAVRRPGTRIVLIDDFPNTGGTNRKLLQMLYRMGVPPRQIAVLAPRHPHRDDWSLPDEIRRGVTVLTVGPWDLYKAIRLDDVEWIESVLGEYYGRHGWNKVRVQHGPETLALNTEFDAQLAEGFQVRLKRVFELSLEGDRGKSTVRVLAKSAGWGWYGYHAYISGTRLAGFVPEVIGLREGFLFCTWIESPDSTASSARIGAYVARRAEVLRLDEDPVIGSVDYRWVGWNEMLEMLRGVYGPFVGRLKVPCIRRHLARNLSRIWAVLDGQMKPADWVGTGDEAYKTDFEQHNFGGPEFDFVDPAYDLAGAIFETGMGEADERIMLETYVRKTGDSDVYNRIPLFKACYASVVLTRSADALSWGGTSEKMRRRESLNRLAREFLTTHMNRNRATTAGCRNHGWPWSGRVFFLDLDGTFYGTHLGFPHPTPQAIAALGLMRSRGISVVVNTARDVAHVREFCRVYGIPGGVAESGSVFVDAAASREVPLISAGTAEMLKRCREVLQTIDGVYVDDAFRFSVRVCRIEEGKRTALGPQRTARLLRDVGVHNLSVVHEHAHTDITQRGTNKGTGVNWVLQERHIRPEQAAAIGDSDRDVPMLIACGTAYVPRRCSIPARRAARFKKDLLSAACHFARHRGRIELPAPAPGDPFEPLLRVAHRSRLEQLARIALFRSL